MKSQAEIEALALNFYRENPKGVFEILGPTASGKTGLSVKLAHFIEAHTEKNVEIISVDSRQVYRDCDVSSAKISEAEMDGIIHHGIDFVDLDQEYSVYNWQQYAFDKIKEIQDRGNLVMMCGGTMLWLDAVSENYDFDIKGVKSSRTQAPLWTFLKIGIKWPREVLYERINSRAISQFEDGLIEETKAVMKNYPGITKSAFTSFGYQEIAQYLAGEITYERALELNQQRNRNYAKKQLTWWRGRADVIWIKGEDIN